MKKIQRILFISVTALFVLFFIIRLVVYILMQSSPALGVQNGQLPACPDYPACVSSQADPEDDVHYVSAIENDKSVDEAKSTIITIMDTLTGAVLVAEEENYLHYEIRVAPFGFVDDVEFYIPGDLTPIELRSSARVPYYDFEVNRERAELLRDYFTKE